MENFPINGIKPTRSADRLFRNVRKKIFLFGSFGLAANNLAASAVVCAVVVAAASACIAVIVVAAAEPENKQDNDDPAAAVVAKVKTTVHKKYAPSKI